MVLGWQLAVKKIKKNQKKSLTKSSICAFIMGCCISKQSKRGLNSFLSVKSAEGRREKVLPKETRLFNFWSEFNVKPLTKFLNCGKSVENKIYI